MDEIPSGISARKFPSRTCAAWVGSPIIGSGTDKSTPDLKVQIGTYCVGEGRRKYHLVSRYMYGKLTDDAADVDLSD
jgi:hypothetical protein